MSELLALIDQLDDLVLKAKQVPLTGQVRMDREEIYALLDRMRSVYADEIKAASAGRLMPPSGD